jgi:hypothetical protein
MIVLFWLLLTSGRFNYWPLQLWYVDGEDDDDFEEIMNEIDGDDQMEQASNDSDFEDDDNGDDDWFASIFKTLVHDVCFSFYGLKN